MQSWILDESPGRYRWGDIAPPPVGADDVLIRVVASALNHMDHCPLCGLTAGGMVMAVASPALAEPSNLSHLLPALFLHAPRPLFAWASVQARAPPGLA